MTDVQKQFIAYVLHYLDAIPGKNNVKLLYAWEKKESRKPGVFHGNNLLNTTWKDTDSTTFNSAGVQNFRSLSRGAQLNVKTMTQSGYPGIVQGIKNNSDPEAVAKNNISEFNKWGTGNLTDTLKSTSNITDAELSQIKNYLLSMVTDKDDPVNVGSSSGAIVPVIIVLGLGYVLTRKKRFF